MSTVFEPVVSGGVVAKNGKSNGNGTGTSRKREIVPIGLNGQKVVGPGKHRVLLALVCQALVGYTNPSFLTYAERNTGHVRQTRPTFIDRARLL